MIISQYHWGRRIFHLLAIRALLASFAVAIEVEYTVQNLEKEATESTQTCRSISETICENVSFSSFCDLIKDTGFQEVLDDPAIRYTVFLPTNSALETFGIPELLEESSESIDANNNETEATSATTELTELILLHMTSDRVDGVDLQDCGRNITMDSGEEVLVSCGRSSLFSTSIFLYGGGNNVDEGIPEVVATDIMACNGLIHVIDGVLRPEQVLPEEPPEELPEDFEDKEPGRKPHNDAERPVEDCKSIAEVVCGIEELTAMCNFISDENILESDITNATTQNEVWTVFAPTDQGFRDIQDFLGNMSVDKFMDLLKFHVVPGKALFSENLECDTELTMGNSMSSQTICSSFSGFIFQQGPGNALLFQPRIIAEDLGACDGVVHIVNNVMVPDLEISGIVGRTGVNGRDIDGDGE